MSNTIQTAPSAPAPVSDTPAVKAPDVSTRPVSWYLLQGLKTLASLRLTVVLFVLSLLLVFFGTLAQIDGGIWSVVATYFRWFWVWIPFQLLVEFGQVFLGFPEWSKIPGSFPFPGGLTLGVLLLVNLLSAHAVRFKLSWKRTGILLIHFGLVLMILGEFIAYFAVEGKMSIEEGENSNVVYNSRRYELSVIRPDDADKNYDHVTVVPGGLLKKSGAIIHSEELPFDIDVVKWFVNAGLRKAVEVKDNPATKGRGLSDVAFEQGEVSGVSTEQSVELPACYLKFTKKDGTDLGVYLMSTRLGDQAITVDGKTYKVGLRFEQAYKPYSLELLEFRYDRYPGTDMAKNFSSKVRLRDSETDEDRVVLIRMNEPLRHRGETFYQADWNKATEKGTVLQVVRNPGWLLPYFSCVIVALGMIVHFGLNLSTFLQRRAGG